LERLSRPGGTYTVIVCFLISKDKVVDDRKKVAEGEVEDLYTSSLLRKEEKAALHKTCLVAF